MYRSSIPIKNRIEVWADFTDGLGNFEDAASNDNLKLI